MRTMRHAILRRCVMIANGGCVPGILQGFSLISWSSFFTSFLTYWLSALVGLLLGGNPGSTGGF